MKIPQEKHPEINVVNGTDTIAIMVISSQIYDSNKNNIHWIVVERANISALIDAIKQKAKDLDFIDTFLNEPTLPGEGINREG